MAPRRSAQSTRLFEIAARDAEISAASRRIAVERLHSVDPVKALSDFRDSPDILPQTARSEIDLRAADPSAVSAAITALATVDKKRGDRHTWFSLRHGSRLRSLIPTDRELTARLVAMAPQLSDDAMTALAVALEREYEHKLPEYDSTGAFLLVLMERSGIPQELRDRAARSVLSNKNAGSERQEKIAKNQLLSNDVRRFALIQWRAQNKEAHFAPFENLRGQGVLPLDGEITLAMKDKGTRALARLLEDGIASAKSVWDVKIAVDILRAKAPRALSGIGRDYKKAIEWIERTTKFENVVVKQAGDSLFKFNSAMRSGARALATAMHSYKAGYYGGASAGVRDAERSTFDARLWQFRVIERLQPIMGSLRSMAREVAGVERAVRDESLRLKLAGWRTIDSFSSALVLSGIIGGFDKKAKGESDPVF